MTLKIHDKPPTKGMFQAIKDEARNSTIEECARVAESYGPGQWDTPRHIAAAIRVLKDKK